MRLERVAQQHRAAADAGAIEAGEPGKIVFTLKLGPIPNRTVPVPGGNSGWDVRDREFKAEQPLSPGRKSPAPYSTHSRAAACCALFIGVVPPKDDGYRSGTGCKRQPFPAAIRLCWPVPPLACRQCEKQHGGGMFRSYNQMWRKIVNNAFGGSDK